MYLDFGEARDVFRIFSPGTKTASDEEMVAGGGRRVRDEREVLARVSSRSPPWEEHPADLEVNMGEDPRLKREAITKVLGVSNGACISTMCFCNLMRVDHVGGRQESAGKLPRNCLSCSAGWMMGAASVSSHFAMRCKILESYSMLPTHIRSLRVLTTTTGCSI